MGQQMGTAMRVKCCAEEDGDATWDREYRMKNDSDFWHGETMPWIEVQPQSYSSDMQGGLRGMQGVSCCKADVDEFPHHPGLGEGDGLAGPSSGGLFTRDPDLATAYNPQMESLSYVPVRFDESTTVDMERSQARYSKIAAHSTRAQTQRRSNGWEEWLRGATTGRDITYLEGLGDSSDKSDGAFIKLPATYHVDRSMTKLWIIPANQSDSSVTVVIDFIQVICAATDFMLLLDQVEAKLDETERSRAILIQYKDSKDGDERRRICFLEDSSASKERFIHALTALWLEKRNDHSMWF